MAKISDYVRHQIIFLHQEGKSLQEIAKKTKASVTGIRNVIKKFNETGSVSDRKRSGRPTKLKKDDEKYLRVRSLRDRYRTSGELTEDLHSATGTSVDSSTVRRSLRRMGLRGCVAIKKPLLRKGNRQKRKQYAMDHKNWTENDWNQVLWTDESRFEIFGSKRRQYVRRRPGEAYKSSCLNPTIKHGGGSINVWGCISANGVGDLIKIDGKLNAVAYLEILREHAIPSGGRLIGENFTFQQDNSPKHTARVVKTYLGEMEEQGILNTMVWPPQSPDLSIIKHVWEYLDRKRHQRQPTNAKQLFEVLKDEWAKIPQEFIKKLFNSVPNRIASVIAANGGHTSY